MYRVEPHIKIMLQFRAMDAPVEIAVPWNVLYYLDTHAERNVAEDGKVVYRKPDDGPAAYPLCVAKAAAMAAA